MRYPRTKSAILLAVMVCSAIVAAFCIYREPSSGSSVFRGLITGVFLWLAIWPFRRLGRVKSEPPTRNPPPREEMSRRESEEQHPHPSRIDDPARGRN
jgi:hypothetical protein